MAKKKSTTWYGFKTPSESLKIFEVKVIRDEGLRLLLEAEALGPLSKPWVYKTSAYEKYFPTRDEAVAAKLRWLEQDVVNAAEGLDQATHRLEVFKAQEDA